MLIDKLIDELLTNSDPIVKRNSAEMLGSITIPDDRVIKALANGMSCSDRGVRDICSRSLAKPPEGYEFDYAEAVTYLIADNNIELRNLASDVLKTIGPGAVKAILPYTDNNDADIKQFAIEIICNIGDISASEKIMILLDDDNSNVRNAAIDALGNMKATDAVTKLIDMFPNEQELRPMIIESLGKIGGNESLNFLTELLKSEVDPLLKLSCIDALAFEGEGIEICKRLMSELPDAPGEIQVYILKTIYAISYRNGLNTELPSELRPIAYSAIEDDDIDLRSAGLIALGSSYYIEDLAALFKEMQRNNAGTQQLIISNLLIYSESRIIEEFFVEYCLSYNNDIEPLEFLSCLPFIWDRIPEENKIAAIKTITGLVFHPETCYTLDIMDILFNLDYKNIIEKMLELIPSADSRQLELMIETIQKCSLNDNVSIMESLTKVSESIVVRYKELIN